MTQTGTTFVQVRQNWTPDCSPSGSSPSLSAVSKPTSLLNC